MPIASRARLRWPSVGPRKGTGRYAPKMPLCGAALVTMMESADFRHRNNPPHVSRLDRARNRRVLLPSQVRPAPMIVAHETLQVTGQARFAEHDYVIQGLWPTNRTRPESALRKCPKHSSAIAGSRCRRPHPQREVQALDRIPTSLPNFNIFQHNATARTQPTAGNRRIDNRRKPRHNPLNEPRQLHDQHPDVARFWDLGFFCCLQAVRLADAGVGFPEGTCEREHGGRCVPRRALRRAWSLAWERY